MKFKSAPPGICTEYVTRARVDPMNLRYVRNTTTAEAFASPQADIQLTCRLITQATTTVLILSRRADDSTLWRYPNVDSAHSTASDTPYSGSFIVITTEWQVLPANLVEFDRFNAGVSLDGKFSSSIQVSLKARLLGRELLLTQTEE